MAMIMDFVDCQSTIMGVIMSFFADHGFLLEQKQPMNFWDHLGFSDGLWLGDWFGEMMLSHDH